MNTPCHYAIVRFVPFIETGEFANVGIVLFAPKARYFGFKLLTHRYARITNFFDQLEGKVFRQAMRTMRLDMERIDGELKRRGTDRRFKALDLDGALEIWKEVIKPRETIIRFSEPRLVLATDPKVEVSALYEYYVERNFINREYQERLLERAVRGWLREANLQDRFLAARIGNDDYHAQFPFVNFEHEKPKLVIKPLNLRYQDAARIIDHGGQWIVRVKALKKRGLLPKALFAVDGPEDLTARGKAKEEVVAELADMGVQVQEHRDRQAIIDFARSGY